ncbi:hypothetical protein [Wolbachia endosymbiont of Mansonella perstans]|uniref:hypothetical protein n=1 Tax=Wolbachia endosymbiont of Mansonella perstans TaxID=229526 RepID=UPI001CE196EB|nr:hypothetical protein [Wolbachia endosymbiont of Mansonella perstans]MCA4774557.1 hypothetical protein [Wolbachia endosymbiont of Mansonella perstans]
MRYETFYYKEIISKLPKVELDKIDEAVGADYRASKLTGENIFNLLLYNILEKNELSLLTIEESYHRMFNFDTRHSSVASRLETIPTEYFEKIFCLFYRVFGAQKKLMIIDSTILQLSINYCSLAFPAKT